MDAISPTQLTTTSSSDKAVRGATQLEIFGPPPLLEGESQEAYNTLLARVSGAINPKDILEEIWVKDIVDHEWVILGLRRLRVALLNSSAAQGLHSLFDSLGIFPYERENKILINNWTKRQRRAIKAVDKLLSQRGANRDSLMAETLSISLDKIEPIDLAIARAEVRRDAAYREIERRRLAFGQALQKSTQQIESASILPDDNGSFP
jgi:hypothetical protein